MTFNPEMLHIYLTGGTQNTHHDSYEFLEVVEKAMQAGITAFEYQQDDDQMLTADGRLILARRLVELGDHYSVPVIINEDKKIAERVGADGIFLQAPANIKTDLFIGARCSSLAEIRKANDYSDLSYLAYNAKYVFPNAAKLTSLTRLPVLSPNNLSLDEMPEALKMGFAGLAVDISVIDVENIQKTIEKIKSFY